MKKILLLIPVTALAWAQPAASQSNRNNPSNGFLLYQDIMSPSELALLSSWSPQYTTARGTAMGGAFTALGADLATMHINPAGLGMYRSSEFGVTPMVSLTKVTNTDPHFVYSPRNRKNRFSPANVGAAINLYQGGGKLTSFTFGVAYNRIADFNTTNRMYFGDNVSKLGDVFLQQLNGTNHGLIDQDFYKFNRRMWGALLAYNTELIRKLGSSGDQYTISQSVASGVLTDQEVRILNTGSIGEYNISGGFNFGNKLYLGFSVGIQDIYFKQTVNYEEEFLGNSAPATEMYYDMYKKINGSGVNFKAGMIVRPVEALRIGLSVHTPTYYNVNYDYDSDLDVLYSDSRKGIRKYGPEDRYEYDFSTPLRLMGGVSYTFGSVGLISVDYERTWYNTMRYRRDDADKTDFNSMVKDIFTGTNSVRVGTEIRPFDYDISLRAGFNYTGSMVDKDHTFPIDHSPIPKHNIGSSMGIGIRIGRFSTLDLTYSFNQTKYTGYYMYYYEFYNGDILEGGNPYQSINRHAIIASLGIRF